MELAGFSPELDGRADGDGGGSHFPRRKKKKTEMRAMNDLERAALYEHAFALLARINELLQQIEAKCRERAELS